MQAVRSLLVAALLLISTTGIGLAGDTVQKGSNSRSVRQIAVWDWINGQTNNSTTIAYIGTSGNVAGIDCLGARARAWGLEYGYAATGGVKVKTFPDGSGEVQINVNFSNAIMWATDVNAVPVFAYRPQTLAGNPSLTPGLASGHFSLTYLVPDAANPELDFLTALFFGGDITLQSLKFHAEGTGPLLAGFGVPEGTPGLCSIHENDLLKNRENGKISVEHVEVRLAGQAAVLAPMTSTSSPTDGAEAVRTSTRSSWGKIKSLYR